MYKLTLSVDERIAGRAKRYAERKRTSVRIWSSASSMSSRCRPELRISLKLNRLRGCLKGTDPEAYRRRLLRKYQ